MASTVGLVVHGSFTAAPAVSPDVAFCLQRVRRDRAGWDTLVVSGTADTTVPAEVMWAMWTDLERVAGVVTAR